MADLIISARTCSSCRLLTEIISPLGINKALESPYSRLRVEFSSGDSKLEEEPAMKVLRLITNASDQNSENFAVLTDKSK